VHRFDAKIRKEINPPLKISGLTALNKEDFQLKGNCSRLQPAVNSRMTHFLRTYPKIIEEPHFECLHSKSEPLLIFRIDTTHRPGLRPEDMAPTGQLTNKIRIGMLKSSQLEG
jgi:hypothetical protein